MGEKRKPIGKKLRFEVFKRDSFTCQYCGKIAPDVILEVDHIVPVAEGGTNDIINLITACFECNRGKGATGLSDDAVVKKQHAQLAELNERREQMKMIAEWRKGLNDSSIDGRKIIEEDVRERTGATFKPHFKREVERMIRRYGFQIVYDAYDASMTQYYHDDNASLERAANMIGRIAYTMHASLSDPMFKERAFIRGILRKRFGGINDELRLKVFLMNNCNDDEDAEIIRSLVHLSDDWDDFWENARGEYGGDW